MNYIPLVSKILFSFLLSSIVLYRYGNWYRHRLLVTLVVLIAWTFSFLIIFALPLDVISTVFRQCVEQNGHFNVTFHPYSNVTPTGHFVTCKEPWSRVPERIFPNLWRTVYWSTQFLTWLIMPMMQSYIKAGDFTIKGKIKSALVDNAIYYGSYLLICGILLIYLAMKPGIDLDWSKLKAIASSASNTWGLFLLILLLGYALVEVPRTLWSYSNHSYVLTRSYFKAAKLSSEKCEAEETVDDVLESLQAVAQTISPHHTQYANLETILNKIPIELRDRMSRRHVAPDDTRGIDNLNEKALIRLHKQTIKSLQVLQRTETQWTRLVQDIFHLEDVLKSQISRERHFKSSFEPGTKNLWTVYVWTPTIQWYWRCICRGYCMRIAGLAAGVLSATVMWSELTFFNKTPVLSVFAIIVKEATLRYDYFTIEVLSTVVILYLSYCAYSTVLKIKFFNLYYLAPHHQTNEYSLIFSGMMLSRLTPPLCLNFLSLIHMDSHIIKQQILETHYTQIMGHMDVIAIISNGFNIYFPMAIALLCVATYFSLGSRVLTLFGFHQFIGDDEMTVDLIEEGRELIKREKRRRQRAEVSTMRRKDFEERFGFGGPPAPPSDGSTISRFQRGFHHRNSSDTIRPIGLENLNSRKSTPNARSNLVDTKTDSYTIDINNRSNRLPLDYDDIDSRFGPSTGIPQNYRSNNDNTDLEPDFSSSTSGNNNNTRNNRPPRGFFDDV